MFGGQTFIFEPGESVAVNTTLLGVNVFMCGLLFPTSISSLYSPRLLSLSTGTNLLYRCPAGKCAVGPILPADVAGNPTTTIEYVNDSGASRTISYNIVPSGNSLSGSNLVSTASVNDKTLSSTAGLVLFPGDAIIITTSANTATQWARMTVAEIPFP
jgi:hypothetical protein